MLLRSPKSHIAVWSSKTKDSMAKFGHLAIHWDDDDSHQVSTKIMFQNLPHAKKAVKLDTACEGSPRLKGGKPSDPRGFSQLILS